jgi:hypothetical protein
MTRIVRPGGHSFSPNVEEVRRLRCRIGNTSANTAAAIDQDRGNAAPRQLRGQDGPGRSATDYRDRNGPLRFRSQASSPD